MWAQIINVIIGIWLMAAPDILNYNGTAADMDRIFGPVIATLAAVAIAECTRNVRLWNVPLGAWLLIQPWILDYGINVSIFNSMISGVLIIMFSLIRGKYNPEHFGGGWSSLWK